MSSELFGVVVGVVVVSTVLGVVATKRGVVSTGFTAVSMSLTVVGLSVTEDVVVVTGISSASVSSKSKVSSPSGQGNSMIFSSIKTVQDVSILH